jgi:F-type H+-transporting ATPase subunit gamma
MAGQLKEVRNRIKSIQNTQQITKAMKMVSAAKLRRAQDAIIQMRPYARKLQELLSNIVGDMQVDYGMHLAIERPIEKVLLIVITSDRGLAGAYNSNVIKLAKATIKEKYPAQHAKGHVTIWSMGKKGYEHFLKNNYPVTDTFRDIFHHPDFEHAQAAAKAALNAFVAREFDVVEIVYSQFRNAASQTFVVEKFLPIQRLEKKPGTNNVNFIFEPGMEQLLMELVPKILDTQVYKAVLDASASEHGARMTAMDKASDNANEMLKALKLSYNRARQAAITTELTEIVSGAAALEG